MYCPYSLSLTISPLHAPSHPAYSIRRSYVFPKGAHGAPKWAVSDYWAPEIHVINATRFNVYYAARYGCL